MRFSGAILAAGLVACLAVTPVRADAQADCLAETDPQDGLAACRAAIAEREWPVDELVKLMAAEGNHLRASGNAEGALAVYDEALAMTPGNGSLLAEKGRALQQSGDDRGAADAYAAAIRAGVASPLIFNNRGVAHLNLGELPAAVADFDAALALDPDYGNAWNNRANAHCADGAVEASVADRIRALYAGRFTAAAAQAGLRKSGFYDGPADGIWGPDSEDALRVWTASGCPSAPKTRID